MCGGSPVDGRPDMTDQLRLWHGGAPDLRVGDLITPRPHTDQRHLIAGCVTCEARRRNTQIAGDDNDPAMVYVTSNREYARIYAAGYGPPGGALYRVEAVGDLTPLGPDADPEPSWGVAAARVLAVYDACVTMSVRQMERLLRRYWSAR